jgi:hypothetical protein
MMDDFDLPEAVEDLFAGFAVVAAGTLVRSALGKLWERGAKRPPPRNPAAHGVSWGEALAWASAVGVAVGITRVITRRALTRR